MCVRAVQFWGADLQLFQFDYDLTWAVLFLNADKTIYGRYGTRNSLSEASRHITLEGLRKAMEGALELHAGYPGNKKNMMGKTGPKPAWPVPELIPENKGKPEVRPSDGADRCLHCHQAREAAIWTLRKSRQAVPDEMIRVYPMPEIAGFCLDPNERARVTDVLQECPADRAGLRVGDDILRFDGQPILSIADVQWVLQHAKEEASMKVEVHRGGKPLELALALPRGWRRRIDFTWREWTWGIRHRLLGTERVEGVSDDEKKGLGIPGMALRIQELPPDWVEDRNSSASQLRAGDIIVEIDGRKDSMSEADLLAYLMQEKWPGTVATLTVLRGTKTQRIALRIP